MNINKTLVFDRATNFGTSKSSSKLNKMNYFFEFKNKNIKFPEFHYENNINDGKGVKITIDNKNYSLFFLNNEYAQDCYTLFFHEICEFTAFFFPCFYEKAQVKHEGVFSFLSKNYHDLERITEYSASQPFTDDFFFRSQNILVGYGRACNQTLLAHQLFDEATDQSFFSQSKELKTEIGTNIVGNPMVMMSEGILILVNKNDDRYLCFYPLNDEIQCCYFELRPYDKENEPAFRV